MSFAQKTKDLLQGISQMILIGAITPFMPRSFFYTMSKRPLKQNWRLFFQGLLLLSIFMAITIAPLSFILIVPILVGFIVPITLIVAVDPFISYIRGDDDHPKKTMARYFMQGFWAVIVALIPVIFGLSLLMNLFRLGIIEEQSINNILNKNTGGGDLNFTGNIPSLLFMIAFSAYFVISQFYTKIARKEHKVVTAICISGFVILTPVVNYFS